MSNEMKMPNLNVDALVEAQRKNFEALNAVGQLTAAGWQAVAKRQGELVRESMEAWQDVTRSSFDASTPEANAAKHADFAQQTFAKALSNLQELSEMTRKNQDEAFEVMNSRFNDGMNELRQAVDWK